MLHQILLSGPVTSSVISLVVTTQFILDVVFCGVTCLTGCESKLTIALGQIYSTAYNMKRFTWNDDTNCRPSPTSALAQDED